MTYLFYISKNDEEKRLFAEPKPKHGAKIIEEFLRRHFREPEPELEAEQPMPQPEEEREHGSEK